MKKSALGFAVLCLLVAAAIVAKREERFASAAAGGSNCVSGLPDSLSLNCVSFSGHLYAVAEIDLRRQKIIFTTSNDGKKETFPEVFSDLAREGIKPLLITNAGIYGTDNRPLGLLISPKGKLHDANIGTDASPAHGNFSWDSAVFQISDEGVASIVPVKDWHSSPHIVAATQSGPELASMGKINASIPVHSESSFLRTAIGIDQKDRRLVYLVVSREPVTLFELADLMASNLHCSEALHLDGDLSAFYLPSAPEKFVFADPGERIVTALSVTSK
ncbi:MAG TPA: phosphodiester glycosidase family protein [Terriglobales bacterium]|nr:phosphodiester glycosidase family protein [Terriglobales bacterium]